MAGNEERDPVITPETKIGRLLDAYPELEDTLVGLAPAFAKLRNPVLRKTVAKVTTLRQAAKVGGVPLGKLINTLRRAAGDEQAFETEAGTATRSEPPAWFDRSHVGDTFDARPLIDAGKHPLAHVMPRLEKAPPGKIIELITPFVPAPLIELLRTKGYAIWSDESEPGCIRTYIMRLS